MKKLFISLLAVFFLLLAFILEGGMIRELIVPTALIPLLLGTFLSTLFAFRFSEIRAAFTHAFSNSVDKSQEDEYQKSIIVLQSLSSSILNWALAIIVVAMISVLSNITTPERLGMSIAATLTCLLYASMTKAALFVPMEHSLKKKIHLLQHNEQN